MEPRKGRWAFPILAFRRPSRSLRGSSPADSLQGFAVAHPWLFSDRPAGAGMMLNAKSCLRSGALNCQMQILRQSRWFTSNANYYNSRLSCFLLTPLPPLYVTGLINQLPNGFQISAEATDLDFRDFDLQMVIRNRCKLCARRFEMRMRGMQVFRIF